MTYFSLFLFSFNFRFHFLLLFYLFIFSFKTSDTSDQLYSKSQLFLLGRIMVLLDKSHDLILGSYADRLPVGRKNHNVAHPIKIEN